MHWHMQRDHGTMSRLEKPRFGLRDNWHPEYDNYDADYEDGFDNNEGRDHTVHTFSRIYPKRSFPTVFSEFGFGVLGLGHE